MNVHELEAALKNVDPDKYMRALLSVYVRQMDPEESSGMFDTFREEYAALAGAGIAAVIHGGAQDLTPRERSALATGAMVTVIALKDMIDTEKFKTMMGE